MTLNIEPVVVQNVVEEVHSALSPQAEQKGYKLNVTVPETDITLQTDRRALTQILLNLTSNAIKFTDQGEVHILLTRESYNGKFWTQLAVRDTGIGIRPEDQPKLFQIFSQVEANPQRHHGAGLGLHLSKKLAHLLHGQIHFKSEYGKGSTFILSLPDE